MEQQAWDKTWRVWLNSLPKSVHLIAEQFPPWVPLRIKRTGQKCHIHSFDELEDGSISLQVGVRPEENPDTFHSLVMPEGHRVLGLKPTDLELCL